MTHLLELEYGVFKTPMDRYLYTYTHDEKSDPYTPQKNAQCDKLNKWMKDIQSKAPIFSDWITSDEIQNFYKEFEKEVGYNLNDKDAYKICSNIMFMYCGGIDLIPNVISDGLFNKIHNFTLEYRKRLLHSGKLSVKTTTLATMPFAWIFKTLITDFIKNLQGFKDDIDGYMQAEQAKIVFHSTRGISTLLILEPLGLSTGIQPVYANLVNLEIYSRSDHDLEDSKYESQKDNKYGYDKYLFRFTGMGQFMPFNGCDDDYDDGMSTLCNLQVLIDKLDEYAMYLKDWEPYCKNITETYFQRDRITMDNMNAVSGVYSYYSSNRSEKYESIWYLFVGIIIGVLSTWIIERRQFVLNLLKHHKYDTLS